MTMRSPSLPALASLPLVALAGLGAPAAPAHTAASVPAACHSALQKGVLPVWARTGFSSPRPRMPHVMGRDGGIVAIEFGYPLLSPPSPDRANKILWVGKAPRKLSNLWIRAQRMEGTRAVGQPTTRLLRNGPGPSYVDVPEAGCWRLSLTWADGRHDTLDLQYTS
jgi:hypothetical protein